MLKDRKGFMWFSTDDGLNHGTMATISQFFGPILKTNIHYLQIILMFFLKIKQEIYGVGSKGLSLYDRNTESCTNFTSIKNDDKTLSNHDLGSIFQDSKKK